MQMNVSQLLQAPVGTTRNFQIKEFVDVINDGHLHLIEGKVQLLRTSRSILVKGKLRAEVELSCSRCLSPFVCPLYLIIEEEYMPTVNVITGIPLPPPEEPGSFTIDSHHVLDLTEAVRQYSLLAIPMKPVCHKDCAGLCPGCGQNLNQGPCACPVQETDPRWSTLIKVREQ